MREIKFRAYSLLSNKVCFHGKELTLNKIRRLGESYFTGEIEWVEYTGLKDKNGKEIYEGDIVRNNKQVGVVKWEEGDWDRYWTHVIGLAWWLEDNPEDGVEDASPENIEVIGNIFENPELLKEEL